MDMMMDSPISGNSPSEETTINSNYNTEEDEHSSHCDKCINIASCNKVRILRKSRPEDVTTTCPIVYCRLNCGHQFHECKNEEHKLLCPKVKVPCINSEYGCPLILERGRKGQHLETCPASVMVCTMEWNRWPLPPGKCQPFALDPDQLDVASTQRDQKTLSEWKQSLPSSLRYLLKTHVTERHPVMPLGVSGHRIPQSILNQAMIEREVGGVDVSESTESEHDESSDSPWGWKNSPPGLQESVCNKLKALNLSSPREIVQVAKEIELQNGDAGNRTENDNSYEMEDDDFHSCSSSLPGDEDNKFGGFVLEKRGSRNGIDNHLGSEIKDENGAANVNNKRKDVELSLIVEVRTRCQRKPDSMYTFMCSREFRRDEFPAHFSHIHSGIHTQLNGWLFTRCPLANQGCSFGVERMYPFDENYRVVYNQTADAFCFTQNTDDHLRRTSDKTDNDNEEKVSLSSLPFEVLVHLTKYLDPLSLNSMSMANRLLRDVSSCVIVERGIVVLQWEKNESDIGWEVTEKKWMFSTYFSPIRKWAFSDLGRMTNHMKTCPCYERNIPSKPFAYPVSIDQL